LNTILGNIFRW